MTFGEAQAKGLNYAEIIIKNNEKILISNYRKAYNNISSQLKNLYITIQESGIPQGEYYNYMTQYKRLERLQESIYAEYRKASLANKGILINNSTQVITDSFYRRLFIINWPLDTDQIFTVLDDRVISESVLGTAEKWGDLVESYGLKNGYIPQSNTLLETLKANDLKALQKIQTTLTQGFLQGTSYTKMAREFKDVLSNVTYNSLRIARTEGTRVMNAGSLAASNYARSEGINLIRQWHATLDSNTRSSHASADGQREDENGMFHVGGAIGPYPANMSTAAESVNCRCTTIDIVDGWEPELRRARNPVTGKTDIIGYRDFETWAGDNGLKWTKKGWK